MTWSAASSILSNGKVNHALDIVKAGEFDGVLAVLGVPGVPALDGRRKMDQETRGDGQVPDGCDE